MNLLALYGAIVFAWLFSPGPNEYFLKLKTWADNKSLKYHGRGFTFIFQIFTCGWCSSVVIALPFMLFNAENLGYYFLVGQIIATIHYVVEK